MESNSRVLRVPSHDGRDVSQHQPLDLGPGHVHVQEVTLGVQPTTPRPSRHLLGHLLHAKRKSNNTNSSAPNSAHAWTRVFETSRADIKMFFKHDFTAVCIRTENNKIKLVFSFLLYNMRFLFYAPSQNTTHNESPPYRRYIQREGSYGRATVLSGCPPHSENTQVGRRKKITGPTLKSSLFQKHDEAHDSMGVCV